MHTPYIIVFYPHQPLFWTMKRVGAGMHFIPFVEYAVIDTWNKKNNAVIHDHFRQIILFFLILNVFFFLSREIVSMYTHVYCSHAFPLLWYVCCSWYVQYGLILFLTLITCKNMFKILTISLSLKQKKTTKNYQLPKYKSFKENYFETLNSNDDDF